MKKIIIFAIILIIGSYNLVYANTYTSTMPFSYSDLISTNAYAKVNSTNSNDWYGIMINETAQMFCGYIESITDTEDVTVKLVKFRFDIDNINVPLDSISCYAFSINWDNTGFVKSLEYKNKVMEVPNAR